MAHSHAGHDHDHAPVTLPSAGGAPAARHGFTAKEARQARRLSMVVAIIGGFFVVQLGGAIWADSVVLQADAMHLLMDVLVLGVSLVAMRLAVRVPTPRFTYGLRRAEPVAAIFSAVLVLGTTAAIVTEGVGALMGRGAPKVGIMLAFAVVGLVVNGLSAWLLHDVIGHGDHDHDHDRDGGRGARGHALNLRGAWLHLLGDALGALAALAAALTIRMGGPPAADPIASFVVAAILFVGALRLLGDATLVLLEAAPRHLPVAAIQQVVAGFPGVTAVRDLHAWSLGAGHDAVTVHVCTESLDPALGLRLSKKLREALGVEYVTVQVDSGTED